jgi:hypothetical protein
MGPDVAKKLGPETGAQEMARETERSEVAGMCRGDVDSMQRHSYHQEERYGTT